MKRDAKCLVHGMGGTHAACDFPSGKFFDKRRRGFFVSELRGQMEAKAGEKRETRTRFDAPQSR